MGVGRTNISINGGNSKNIQVAEYINKLKTVSLLSIADPVTSFIIDNNIPEEALYIRIDYREKYDEHYAYTGNLDDIRTDHIKDSGQMIINKYDTTAVELCGGIIGTDNLEGLEFFGDMIPLSKSFDIKLNPRINTLYDTTYNNTGISIKLKFDANTRILSITGYDNGHDNKPFRICKKGEPDDTCDVFNIEYIDLIIKYYN